MRRVPLKGRDDREDPSRAEKAFMLASAAFSVLLFGYLVWQAATAPGGGPQVEVAGMETAEDGQVLVRVRLTQLGAEGLLVAEVVVACGEDPPRLSFENVPAEGSREGIVVCPPGTAAPEARISHYVEA